MRKIAKCLDFYTEISTGAGTFINSPKFRWINCAYSADLDTFYPNSAGLTALIQRI
jgi:hypothetical protein